MISTPDVSSTAHANPARLSPLETEAYGALGYHLPVDVLSPSQAAELRERLETVPMARLADLPVPWVQKSHLLFPWLDDLVRHPALIGAVASIFGPDLLVLSADLFIKPARSRQRIGWHQDLNYWGLDPMEVATAWIALTDATVENGCMRYSPMSHRFQRLPHRETYSADSMLSRGQEIAVDIDEAAAVAVELAAGQAALHDGLMAHASGPNDTDATRIGFAVRYAPTYVRQTEGPPISAMLVAGQDRYGHFALEQRPETDLAPAAIEAHHRALSPHAATRFSTI